MGAELPYQGLLSDPVCPDWLSHSSRAEVSSKYWLWQTSSFRRYAIEAALSTIAGTIPFASFYQISFRQAADRQASESLIAIISND